jgi:hypothetical protein
MADGVPGTRPLQGERSLRVGDDVDVEGGADPAPRLIENPWNIGERQHLGPGDRTWMGISLFWSYFRIMAPADLPVTATGKVQKFRLQELLAETFKTPRD